MAEISDFVFENHILKLEDDSLEKFVEYAISSDIIDQFTSKIFKKTQFNEKKRKVLENYHLSFSFINKFFADTLSLGYCNVKYIVEEDTHAISLSGSGVEDFDINGASYFGKKDIKEKQKNTGKNVLWKFTRIPVTQNTDDFNLILDGHTQTEMPDFGKISVFYDFYTKFSLGDQKHMTKKLTNTDGFYGEPGKVYFRYGDTLALLLKKSIFGSIIIHKVERTNLHFQGQVYMGNTLIYQGTLESDGTFPFYIRGEPRDHKKKEIKPRNKTGICIS